MTPAHHQSALLGFFSRHDVPVPAKDAPLIERLGLLVRMAECLRAAEFRTGHRRDGIMAVNGVPFAADEWPAFIVPASIAAYTFEAIETGRAPEHNGTPIDRMALLMRRAEANDLTADADMLAREGIPEFLIAEYALEAAQLAEAMKVAVHAYALAVERRERDAEMASMIGEAA